MKIAIHSVTDLITNSSTTIFTYSGNSEAAFVEMINELFKSFNIDKKCEDVFDTVVLCDEYRYTEYDEDGEDGEVTLTTEEREKLYQDVLTGKVPKPDWFSKVEEDEDGCGFNPSTYLHLIPKSPEFVKLGELVSKFLYSTGNEATYDS
jgi:hypothetical protein